VDFSDEDIQQIVSDIWSAMLGIPVEPAPGVEIDGGRSVSGVVHINGDWEGAIAVNCPEPLARDVTAAMLGLGEDELGDEDVRDAIGEVANMTAGNVKGLLEGECRLSLPAVSEGMHLAMSVPGARVAQESGFCSGVHAFTVTVLERTAG
jgi:chemotaxis protein CheX